MYTGVGCFAAGCAAAAGSGPSWVAAVGLAAVLAGKAAVEERWMAETHTGYAHYRRCSWRFAPWMF